MQWLHNAHGCFSSQQICPRALSQWNAGESFRDLKITSMFALIWIEQSVPSWDIDSKECSIFNIGNLILFGWCHAITWVDGWERYTHVQLWMVLKGKLHVGLSKIKEMIGNEARKQNAMTCQTNQASTGSSTLFSCVHNTSLVNKQEPTCSGDLHCSYGQPYLWFWRKSAGSCPSAFVVVVFRCTGHFGSIVYWCFSRTRYGVKEVQDTFFVHFRHLLRSGDALPPVRHGFRTDATSGPSPHTNTEKSVFKCDIITPLPSQNHAEVSGRNEAAHRKVQNWTRCGKGKFYVKPVTPCFSTHKQTKMHDSRGV